MKVLYYSNLVSKKILQEIIEQSSSNSLPTQSIQKFHSLLIKGLKNEIDVINISSIPFSNKNINLDKCDLSEETGFYYTSRHNRFNIFRHFLNFIMSFFITLKKGKRNTDIGIFDYLNYSVSLGGYLACKILGIKTVVIVTDFPDLMVNQKSFGLVTKLKYKWINSFDGYILLSEYMNEIINKNRKPYLIMEGLVDSSYNILIPVNKEKVLLYAGGLHSKYGINKLVDAFLKTENDYELHLYGYGDSVSYIETLIKSNSRIKYFGTVANNVIVEKISKCTLLVNPRPADLILSRYSFPSKNLEYMLSGTPLLTTKLPSIPKDHYPYIFFLEDESLDGFTKTLEEILSKPSDELISIGLKSNKFVLDNKSDIVQGKRVSEFIKMIINK